MDEDKDVVSTDRSTWSSGGTRAGRQLCGRHKEVDRHCYEGKQSNGNYPMRRYRSYYTNHKKRAEQARCVS